MLYAGCWIIGCAVFTGCQFAVNKIAVVGDERKDVAVDSGRIGIEIPLKGRCQSSIDRRCSEGDGLAGADGILIRGDRDADW